MPEREFLGQGWRFPIQPDGRGRLLYSKAEQDIEEAIWIILSVTPGERVMLPDFGCGAQDFVFQNNSEVVRAAIAASVRQALVRWEPRVDLLDVSATAPGEPNLMLIRVDYRVRSANTVHNLVYPFYISEGGAA
jgi:Bacteriophage baseplate protein W